MLYNNGSSFVIISAESKNLGKIVNCNVGAQRVFGYSMNEMINHHVEKLMPEMYAKGHSRVLEEALSKGPENIPNKERPVYAKHKSGFIFPTHL